MKSMDYLNVRIPRHNGGFVISCFQSWRYRQIVPRYYSHQSPIYAVAVQMVPSGSLVLKDVSN